MTSSRVPVVLRLALSALLAVAAAFPASAQTVTGTLQGTVTDSDRGALPGVSIAVRGTETGFERNLVTNERGAYNATFLPLGTYRVTASLPGFGSVIRDNVQIELNKTTIADFVLDPRATAEVRVTAEPPRINTVNGEIKESLTAEAIQAKPTANPGSFLSLAEVFAGFQENPTAGQNNPTASSGSSINFNGTGTRGATFQINGINNDDSSENQNRQGVALSTIQEFQIITNNFTAEFGRGYGAVVLVQTKSGTNDLHADAYAFHNDTEWNDKSHFSSSLPKPVSTRTQYGMTAGFPVMRDNLFAFLAADRTDLSGERVVTRDVFTAADLARPRLTRGNDTPENRAFIENILARFGTLTPNDPRTPRTWSGFQDFEFPDEDYSARADWQPGESDTVTARWQYTRQIRDADDVILGEAALQNHKQQNYGATWTHVFSSRTIGEARYGLGLRDTNVDIKAGNDTPIVRFTGTTFASTIGNAGGFPIHRDQTDHQFVYNHSTMFGSNHFVKAGTDIRLQQLDDLADSNSRGSWSFTASCAGTTYPNQYAAFLDGCVNSYTKGYGPFALENRINEYNVYLEDSWQPFSNLTLNAGVRYDYVEAPSEADDLLDYGFDDDTDNVAPRVSFAWSPKAEGGFLGSLTGGPGNFSIRGGYGIYYGRIFQSVFSQTGSSLRTNPPNALSLNPTNSLNVADPTNGFVFIPGPQTTRHMITVAEPDLEMPYTHQWNLTVERNLPWNSAIRVSYTGTRGEGLLRFSLDNLAVTPAQGGIVVVDHPNNAPLPGFPDLRGVRIDRVAADWRCAGTGFLPGLAVNATCPVPVPIAPNEISLRAPRTNERRPDPRYTTNLLVSNGAETEYDGLQVEIVKRLSQGLMFQTSYTYSKAKDNVSEATAVGTGDSNQTGPNGKFAWGYSRFDTRHRFAFNGSYLLPFFRNRTDLLGSLLGNWQVGVFVKIASGTPFTVVDSAGGDIDWDGFSENRPVIVDRGVEGRTIDDQGSAQEDLPRSAFRRATPEDSVDDLVGRNSFFTDGVRNVDLGVYKTFLLPWDHSLSVRFEVFNVFNRVQFGFPDNNFNNATFGQILSASNQYLPRTIQLGARYAF
jgi:outer membrane receptor protein involved in Fe transport